MSGDKTIHYDRTEGLTGPSSNTTSLSGNLLAFIANPVTTYRFDASRTIELTNRQRLSAA